MHNIIYLYIILYMYMTKDIIIILFYYNCFKHNYYYIIVIFIVNYITIYVYLAVPFEHT